VTLRSPAPILAALFVASLAPGGTSGEGPRPPLWIDSLPADAGERAVRDALARGGFAGPAATAEALLAAAEAQRGTQAGGLARLAAGLLLLDTNQGSDALTALRNPDIQLTAIADHGLLGQAKALEILHDDAGAAAAYRDASRSSSPVACTALLRGAEAFVNAKAPDKAVLALDESLERCPQQRPQALLRMAEIQDEHKDYKAAAAAYDRLSSEFPSSPQALEGQKRLVVLQAYAPEFPPAERVARDLKRAFALYDSGHCREAAPILSSLEGKKLTDDDAGAARLRLGRCLLGAKRVKDAEVVLGKLSVSSPQAAEAAWALARTRRDPVTAYEAVAERFPGTPWGEESLLALANNYQKDARDDDAVPYFRRLLESYPDGKYADRATWRVAWADYRAKHLEAAALTLERASRLRSSSWTAGFLYWAGRARFELGQPERARQLLEETVTRFKYSYHGLRARDFLARLPAAVASPAPTMGPATASPAPQIPEPLLTRVRQLLLIDRFDEALAELQTAPPTPMGLATIARIEGRRGRLRPAINAMKRAFPEYLSSGGDALTEEVWRTLYPIEFRDMLTAKSEEEGLDPALVAALVCQESTFDPGAVSRAGARGLMQVIPPTGRILAKNLGVPYKSHALHDPATSLDFGTRYLRLMMDRFDGRIERALAAYNAGPHRVEAWTAGRPDISAEEFIENIPFTETRNYVMTILASQEQYRRLYALKPGAVRSSAAR
jgi:soluble lytic murein transglycosylase